MELGGKSSNVFFSDVMAAADDFLDKAVEGLVLYALNKGEGCTCPSRALIAEDIYEAFMEWVLVRVAAIKQGDPLDTETMTGAQVSTAQLEKISSHVDIGVNEGAQLLTGGRRASVDGAHADGYYFEPTLLKGHNQMLIFQEEIFGPVLSVTTFRDEAEALEIANDTLYGLGAGVLTRDGSRAYRMGRAWSRSAGPRRRWRPSRRCGPKKVRSCSSSSLDAAAAPCPCASNWGSSSSGRPTCCSARWMAARSTSTQRISGPGVNRS